MVSCFINKRQDSVDVSWTREFRIKNSCESGEAGRRDSLLKKKKHYILLDLDVLRKPTLYISPPKKATLHL